MSNQVGDCFKFLWPFQNVRTLKNVFQFSVQTLKNSFNHGAKRENVKNPYKFDQKYFFVESMYLLCASIEYKKAYCISSYTHAVFLVAPSLKSL